MMKTYPLESAIKIRDTVMCKDFHTLLEEDQRRVERCLPARPENTLNKIKNRFMGSVTLMYQDSLNWLQKIVSLIAAAFCHDHNISS